MTQWCVTFHIVKHMCLRQKCDYISADALSLISQYTQILHSPVLFTEIKDYNKWIESTSFNKFTVKESQTNMIKLLSAFPVNLFGPVLYTSFFSNEMKGSVVQYQFYCTSLSHKESWEMMVSKFVSLAHLLASVRKRNIDWFNTKGSEQQDQKLKMCIKNVHNYILWVICFSGNHSCVSLQWTLYKLDVQRLVKSWLKFDKGHL